MLWCMAGKRKQKTERVVTQDQIGSYLKVEMHKLGLDVLGYSKKIGVSRELIYMVMNGSRAPSKEIIQKIGLETAYRLPGSPLLLSAADLRMYVVVKLQDSKLDPKGYAAKLDIHEQTLYTILAGTRLVPKSLIEKYGLEMIYRIL
jgi:predicted transcriptional regulator